MNDKSTYLLAGDIGGTKTNLGLFIADGDTPRPHAEKSYVSGEADSLEAMVADLLEAHSVSVAAACFGIAGPVTEGDAKLTNLSWRASEDRLRQHFDWKQVELINDLTATALAIPWLDREELIALNRPSAVTTGNLALVAPGTGLGQALLLATDSGYLPMASEGGHADFAPTDEAEIALWRYLQERYGHVSAERVISGQGLVNIHAWLIDSGPKGAADPVRQAVDSQPGVDPAQIISQYALDGSDATCKMALLHFCRILGAVAGNLALTGLATGGVYLGGGIPPKILPMLQRSDFMNRFCAKGRFSDLLAAIPVHVICNDKAALIGAARRALAIASAI